MAGGTALFLQNRDFFGAMVVHVPLVHALRERALRSNSGASITIYSPFERGRIFESLGLASETRVGYGGAAILSELRTRRFDTIVTLRPQSFGLTAAIGASGARERIGFRSA